MLIFKRRVIVFVNTKKNLWNLSRYLNSDQPDLGPGYLNTLFIMFIFALQIQKIWRGYYTRKYIHNYYSRKQYLEGLVIKNEIVR